MNVDKMLRMDLTMPKKMPITTRLAVLLSNLIDDIAIFRFERKNKSA